MHSGLLPFPASVAIRYEAFEKGNLSGEGTSSWVPIGDKIGVNTLFLSPSYHGESRWLILQEPVLRQGGKSSSKKSRKRKNLQKPNGVIGPRVEKVGGERFAIVCVDPAKHRSAWMMADYFGNPLIEPRPLEHCGAFFELAVEQTHHAQQQHDIQNMIVVVSERKTTTCHPNERSPTFDTARRITSRGFAQRRASRKKRSPKR